MGSDIERLLDDHDATAIAAAIRSGEVDAGDVVATSIARAEERNPALSAFVTALRPGGSGVVVGRPRGAIRRGALRGEGPGR